MYKQNKMSKTTAIINQGSEGECIEAKINRIVNNNEPITDGAPITYTDRKDGVLPEMDIRTDRFEIAVEAQDKLTKYKLADRKQRMDARLNKDKPKDGGTEPIPGTEQGPK